MANRIDSVGMSICYTVHRKSLALLCRRRIQHAARVESPGLVSGGERSLPEIAA